MTIKLSNTIAKIVFLVLALVTLSAVISACEPLITIRVQNQTNQSIQIFNDDVFIDTAVPGGEVKYDLPAIFPDYIVVAKDAEGNVVYTANFTRRDISGKKIYSVVIPPTAKASQQSGNATGE